ncbi:MAG: COQ9 family protein [Jhaorihella sp.]
MSETQTTVNWRDPLLDAILPHVPFDGWTETSFAAAIADSGIDAALARALFPRGAVDLALGHHARGDAAMLARIAATDMAAMRFRDRIAAAVRFRIEAAGERETVRRAVTLFALPQHAADGAGAIWGTVDAIWTALGDTSDDANWYTKRATLSAVYSATLLYWLGDDSPEHRATWAFLDRRIDDVMRIETLKARIRETPAFRPLLAAPEWLLGRIRAPARSPRDDLPGSIRPGPRGN